MAKKQTSEFGTGLTYCLGLFLCHAERLTSGSRVTITDRDAEMWFNGASDHLYELQIPDVLPTRLKNRLHKLRDLALEWGHGFGLAGGVCATYKDVAWAIQEAKDLLRAIDKHYGITTIKGSWE
jgi:hypothetical protein